MKQRLKLKPIICLVVLAVALATLAFNRSVLASGGLTYPPNPQNGSIGLEGTITAAPPTTAPTITIPSSGQSFNTQPVTVSGLCTPNLLIRLYSNGVFVGSAQCLNNSYAITTSLFSGQNQLTVQAYDALGQGSPVSSQTNVTFVSSTPNTATQLLLTSAYAERGANPGTSISWPIAISGGIPPYAISVDWGDATSSELISQSIAGTFTAQHSYKQAGVYDVLIKATDQDGTEAYLQLVGVGNGTVLKSGQSINGSNLNTANTQSAKVAWWPPAIVLPFIIVAFWLGGKHRIMVLRRSMEKSSERLQDQ